MLAAHKVDSGPVFRARQDRYHLTSPLMGPEAYAEWDGGAQDAMLENKEGRGGGRNIEGQPSMAESLLLTEGSHGVDT